MGGDLDDSRLSCAVVHIPFMIFDCVMERGSLMSSWFKIYVSIVDQDVRRIEVLLA